MSDDCCEDTEWLDERIAATKDLIVKAEEGLVLLASGAQSYVLDTGQTRQQFTRSNVASLRITLDMLENRLANYQARRTGCAAARVIPGY